MYVERAHCKYWILQDCSSIEYQTVVKPPLPHGGSGREGGPSSPTPPPCSRTAVGQWGQIAPAGNRCKLAANWRKTSEMFPWSALFSAEPKVLGQRSPEEMATHTLMLELGALVKRTERIRQERALEVRRRRGSAVDYSWLAEPAPKLAYELPPDDVLELQELCAKIPPSQCGPVIQKFRKLVVEFEPEVHEVPRLFRSVLCDSLVQDEDLSEAEDNARASHWAKQRSKSLSFVSFRSRFRINPFKGGAMGGSRGNLPEEVTWTEEEAQGVPVSVLVGSRRGRSRSMPEISPIEERAQS
ncbi:protein RD3-like [Arapaima gigas]